jgi:flagellar P-ring protein precursor FlgI
MKAFYNLKPIILIILLVSLINFPAQAARIKDIADVEGVRGNQLYGYGLVVGLNGTGDGRFAEFTTSSLANMLERLGIRVVPERLQVRNVAAVMVTATLPAFSKPGSRINVSVSSIGDARSINGGTLLITPLKAADGNVYAVAQGAITVGGFSIGAGADAAIQNHPTAGVISEGATVERNIPFDLFQSKRVRVVLREPDFTTASRVVEKINSEFNRPLANAIDAASVDIPLSNDLMIDPIRFVAKVEQFDVKQDVPARVVVNERTGTIVMGDDVTIGKVALAHGNLNIVIRSDTQVSQPNAFAEQGQTQVVSNQDVTVGEETRKLSLVGGDVTLQQVIDALNALGASPRDLISIFNALKRSGALNAELVVM